MTCLALAGPDLATADRSAGKPAVTIEGQDKLPGWTKVVRLDTMRGADGKIEIRAVDVAAWNSTLKVTARAGQYLGVRAVGASQRVQGERLSMAEQPSGLQMKQVDQRVVTLATGLADIAPVRTASGQ